METKFLRFVVFINGLIPAVLMVIDWQRDKLGSNKVEFVTRATGVLALVFLLLTLAVTPLRQLLKWQWLLKQRRLLGLISFAYTVAHLFTYVAWDREWKLGTIAGDVYQRPFIALGMFSFFLMVPLAVTSTDKMIRRMGGRRWGRLHRMTYYTAIGGVLHYYLIVKSDITYPLVFGITLALLLGYRVAKHLRKASKQSDA
jgi:methionine sulfoxide reductase heme-binding subunit